MYYLILLTFFQIFTINAKYKDKKEWVFVGNPLVQAHPCIGNDNVTVTFEPNLQPGEENQYVARVWVELPTHTKIRIKFDSEASVTLLEESASSARIYDDSDHFLINFFKDAPSLTFKVRGPNTGTVPYIISLNVNSEEYCKKPETGFLDRYIIGTQDTAEIHVTVPDESCGRRKVLHTELITNGLETKAGDWPWHAALYRLEKATVRYICGGTLLSKQFVITAAHCVTIRGQKVLPEIMSVVLGKYNLIGGDIATQEIEVYQITVHDEFAYNHYLDNDIALMKLKTEAVFGEYVQPVCRWYADAAKKLPTGPILGTVAGWGFDHTDTLSTQLKQATVPKVSEITCIKQNPVFFGKVLNNRKFCAGWNNGTSACNGDSGGGFHVFIPDKPGDNSANATGAWYLRGIVSMSASRMDVGLCDSYQYVVFTNVARYGGWIRKFVH